MLVLAVVVVIALIIGGWIVSQYNFFVATKARVKASIQEIGNQLKRQADLIPNLEASVKGYMKQEKDVFKMLTDARKQVSSAVKSGDIQKMSDAGTQLASVLPQLQIAVEDNPELKSNEVVGKLMEELRDTADKVMYSRRLLIDLTADYNVRRVTFPTSIIANMFKFEELKGLSTPETGDHVEVSASETKSPKINLE